MRKDQLEEKIHHWQQRLLTFVRWLLISAGIGAVIGGGVGTAFYYTLKFSTQTRTQNPWLVWLLPAGGLFIVWLYRTCGAENSRGTDQVLSAVRSPEPLPARMAPLIFAATAVTHLFGGSAGREGAALQIGGSLGCGAGRLLHLDKDERRIATMCGMGAVFSALFGTPVVAAVFALEVIDVGTMYYSALVPVAVASLAATAISTRFGAMPTRFPLVLAEKLQLLPTLRVAALAALCAAVAILFCRTLHLTGKLYQRLLPNPYLRVLAGGALVAVLMALTGTTDYEGAGLDVIVHAIGGHARPEAFLLKLALTALTLGAGFKGGEIVPSFFIGATFGCWMGSLLGLSPSLGAAVGLICLFCGVVNCPISALLLGCSLFGYSGAPYFLLACAIAYALSGYSGLYTEQHILYSKFHPKYINKKTE